MEKLNRHDFPELDMILWDRAELFVDPEVAFRAYEERWRFVDQHSLTRRERALVKQLTDEYGHGKMLVA
ncbi:hypothetical protein OR573_09370 [Halomonas sp. CH40]